VIRVRGRGSVAFALSVLFLLILGAAALAAPSCPRSPTDQDLDARFSPPGAAFLLGSDDLGRDILSRIIYGSRSALLVGIVSVGIAGRDRMSAASSRASRDHGGGQRRHAPHGRPALVPTVLLAITVVSFLGYGLPQVMIAIGVIYSPTFARIVRAETLVIKTEEYVEASRALGTRLPVIVFRHIVPNLLGKVIVQAAVTFALAVVVEASLSFLGLGMQPPAASWGLMLKDARSFLIRRPGWRSTPASPSPSRCSAST